MTTYGTIPTSSGPIPSSNFEYISRAKERLRSSYADRRPWREFLAVRSIGLPSGFGDSISRVRTNADHFRVNYIIVALLILLLSLLWHPISLIVLTAMMAVWLFFYFLRDEPLVVFHRTIGDRVVLVVLAVVTVGLLLLTRATTNIVVAILIGVVVVVVHGLVFKTEYLDEEVGVTRGLVTSGGSSSST